MCWTAPGTLASILPQLNGAVESGYLKRRQATNAILTGSRTQKLIFSNLSISDMLVTLTHYPQLVSDVSRTLARAANAPLASLDATLIWTRRRERQYTLTGVQRLKAGGHSGFSRLRSRSDEQASLTSAERKH